MGQADTIGCVVGRQVSGRRERRGRGEGVGKLVARGEERGRRKKLLGVA